MAEKLQLFAPSSKWINQDGTLSDLAQGWQKALFRFIGAGTGTIPVTSTGGDGTTTTRFYREDGNYAVPAYPVGADPTASIGSSLVVGTAATFMRSDAAPALDLTTPYTFTSAVTADDLVGGTITGGTVTATGAFGCNGTVAQTAATVNAAIASSAGALYTGTEQTMLNDLKALVNQIRAALVADGIAV